MTKQKNPIKMMMIVAILLLVTILVFQLFVKNKIQLEDEEGNTYTGVEGKFLRTGDIDED